MAIKKKIDKKISALIIIILVFLVITSLHLPGVFHYLEYKSYDMRVRFWADSIYSRPSDEIIVVVLDQESVDWAQAERGWGWPWPRQAYAEIIEFFNMAGAKSVAFDILFTEPSVYSAYVPDDEYFIDASMESGNVIQAVMFSGQSEDDIMMYGENKGSAVWPSQYTLPLFQPEGFGSMLNQFNVGENVKGQFPIPGLVKSAAALGSVYSQPDSDGVYRRLKPFTLFDGKAVPGLSAASLLTEGFNNNIIYDNKSGKIKWDYLSIPVNKTGDALLRFRGELGKYAPYPASDILKSLEAIKKGETPIFDPFYYKEIDMPPFVFVGVFGQGFFDFFPTPISSTYPGVGAHVTMLDNMLMGDFIRESSEILNLIILFLVVTAIVFLTMFSNRIYLSVSGLIFVIAVSVVTSFLTYQFGGLWIPMVTFLAGALASFITVTLYNYATEGSQKRFIKSAFSQYLSPKVIEQIIADPSQLKLGGEKREMTAIFTDVRGFSTFSEALGDPTKLVELLNFYLTKMSNIVLDNQGTIDKYEGDAIIAFFGAPIHYENHASLACRAVINMKKAEPEINREAIATGLVTPAVMEAMFKKGLTKSLEDPCQIFTRIGMNTGDMVVGNMGTPNKMDYTIMGNAVNLAARLEGVNKQYNTGGILISEYTYSNLAETNHANDFIVRPLSRVRVVGINTPLRLYELLDTADDAKPELLEMVKKWEQAFKYYENRDFIAAKNMFNAIYSNNPDDMAAKKYLNRCAAYIESPPDNEKWDNGVDNLTEK